MKKGIILGIGGLILLLALVGPGSAHYGYIYKGANCGFCHVDIVNGNLALTTAGSYFRDVHKFDGNDTPYYANSCLNCHPNLVTFLPLTSEGSFYNSTHRFNDTTLASKLLSAQWNSGLTPTGGCNNCHVNVAGDANGSNFNLITGTPTYLTSTVCQDCHEAKYDNWTNTLHRVMLTPTNKAQAMNLPLPPNVTWANISYVIVTKFEFLYINSTGYFLTPYDTYNTETQAFSNSEKGSGYTCGTTCHTTGYNASAHILPGIPFTFAEPGIACERCHGPAGNGHQVTVNYSGTLCTQCHTGSHHGTGWENSEHYPPAVENGSCMQCHSPFDKYKNPNVPLANTIAVSCAVCHNIHDMTDSKYAATFSNGNFNPTTWSVVADAKLGFFNATASAAAGTDVIDNLSNAVIYPGSSAGIGTGPLNLAGKPVSEVLCSECHFNHGLAHTNGVNFTHGVDYMGGESDPATCTDCHMRGSNTTLGHDLMKYHSNGIFIFQNQPDSSLADPVNSCGGCHATGVQSPASSFPVVPIFNEWNASAHNDKVNSIGINTTTNTHNTPNHFYGTFNTTTLQGNGNNNSGGLGYGRPNTCLQCKSPINWNPANTDNITNINLTDFHGISCMVCHDIHDMGAWLAKTNAAYGKPLPYAWYNKTAIVAATYANGTPSRYQAAYTMVPNTTVLCGNCHNNIRAGNTGPGWASATAATPIAPHGIPAAAVFDSSWKATGLLNFECIDCHMATMTTDSNGNVLPDSQKVEGHSFQVNATLLQSKTDSNGNPECSGCHATVIGSSTSSVKVTVPAYFSARLNAKAIGSSAGNVTVLITLPGNISATIARIQAQTQAQWITTNATVMNALATINAYKGQKDQSRTLIAQAYWNLKLVASNSACVDSGEGSCGVHNPTLDSQLLSSAVTYANQAVAALNLTATTVGIYQNSTGTFYLKNSNTAGNADIYVPYGIPGDIPVVGDWTGQGKTTIGVYRPSTDTFYLRNSNTAGNADIYVPYGISGDIPLVGDWDGNGNWTVGVYRPSTNTFYLRNSNSAGAADTTFQFGPGGNDYVPMTGDWDADGTTEVGLYQKSTGTFYLKNSNSAGAADTTFQFGPVSSTGDVVPLTGDWDADGITEVGLYQKSTGTFYLKNSNSAGSPDTTFQFGTIGGVTPLTGKWTGK